MATETLAEFHLTNDLINQLNTTKTISACICVYNRIFLSFPNVHCFNSCFITNDPLKNQLEINHIFFFSAIDSHKTVPLVVGPRRRERDLSMKELEGVFYDKLLNETFCKNRCGLRDDFSFSCYCDSACIELGDCCLDYEAVCLSGPKLTRDNYTAILQRRPPLAVKCTVLPQLFRDTIMTVSSCNQKTSNETFIVDLCERTTLMNKTLTTELPAMFRGVIYRNKYCAICNNPGEDLSDLLLADIVFDCAGTTGLAYDQWHPYTQYSKYDQAVAKCILTFDVLHLLKDSEDADRYACSDNTEVCNVELTDPRFDFVYLRAMCQKYRAKVMNLYTLMYYSNPHCAMCGGEKDESEVITALFHRGYPFPFFSRMVAVSHQAINTLNHCKKCSVFDYATGECSTLTCPPGHVTLRDRRCARLNVTVPQMLANRDVRTYVVVSTENKEFGASDHKRVIKDICIDNDVYAARPVIHLPCSAFKSWNNWGKVFTKLSFCWIMEVRSGSVFNVVASVSLFASKQYSPIRFPSFYNSKQIDIFVFNLDSNFETGACAAGTPRIRHDVVFPSGSLADNMLPSTFIVLNTTHVYDVTETPILMSWQYNVSDGSWTENWTVVVCEPDIFSCDTVTFQAADYVEGDESFLLFGGTSQQVNIHESNVVRLNSSAIALCAALLHDATGTHETGRFVTGVLTLIGNILSMMCLVFTMATYYTFDQLRTRVGKCIMNLCLALLFAQLSFQVSNAFLPYREACIAVAVVQHYTWLAAFLWMNVLAFDMSCTFADCKSSDGVQNASRLYAFVVYAWGVPAIFIAVCLVLDFCTDLPISYGDKTMCWIVGPRAIVYYFAAPVATVLTANVVMFVRTVVAIKRAITAGSSARQPNEQRRTFVIYMRLTSLMGFTWLFGFLANVDVLSFLSYPYIVCNTCQGVFICVSFTLSQTVRRLWWDRCSKKGSRNKANRSRDGVALPEGRITRL